MKLITPSHVPPIPHTSADYIVTKEFRVLPPPPVPEHVCHLQYQCCGVQVALSPRHTCSVKSGLKRTFEVQFLYESICSTVAGWIPAARHRGRGG